MIAGILVFLLCLAALLVRRGRLAPPTPMPRSSSCSTARSRTAR